MPFENLTKSISFGQRFSAPNRLYFSSIGFDLCDHMGKPLPEFFETYENLMDGGCGFGFLGNASVEPFSQFTDRSLKLVSKDHASKLSPIINVARSKNYFLGIQLQHYGLQESKLNPSKISAASQLNNPPTYHSIKNTTSITNAPEELIEYYIGKFHDAARLAFMIKAPMIQIHAANGYLLSSFLSPNTNHRTDQWGGTPLKRAKILLEIVKIIRNTVQDKMAIFVRLQVDDGLGSRGIEVHQLDDVILAIQDAGADAITCATGIAETFAKFLQDREHTIRVSRYAARFLKRESNLPIGFAASIDSLAFADEIIASGDADFIGFGRAVIADSHFVQKELSHDESEVVRCRWDSYCLRDKKESLADRVYCCVNQNYLRPRHIQKKYEENKQ